jgi:excisionase family DNA binding protein
LEKSIDHFGDALTTKKGGHERGQRERETVMNGFFGLNRLKTRAALVEENGLSGEMAEAVFKRVEPVQHDENGTAFYLEGMVDRAIEEIWLEKKRLSSPPNAFVSERENPNMIALDGMSSINRLADLVSTWLERALEEKHQKVEERQLRMLTPAEAAKALRLNVQTVMAWCRQGRISASKSTGKWLIPREEVDRLLRRYEIVNGKKKGGA